MLADIEARMVAVLDDLQHTDLACSIPGLSPVGPRRSLRDGDLRRFASSRAVVKHAGLAPRQHMSGTFAGRAHLTGARRPHLRTAAWRAVCGAVGSNPVHAARCRHLPPTRPTSSSPPRPRPSLPARSCVSSMPSSPRTGPWIPTSPPTAPAARRRRSRRWPPDLTRRASTSWVGASLLRH